MNILDKVNPTSKAKGLADIGNLKRKILYEEERILEIFADIGREVYKKEDGWNEKVDNYCEDIDTRKNRINRMRLEIFNMRGVKLCPVCNNEVNGKFKFCGVCGGKLLDIEDVASEE